MPPRAGASINRLILGGGRSPAPLPFDDLRSVEVVGLTRLGGLVDALQDAGDGVGLLGKDAGIGVIDDGVDPLGRLHGSGIAGVGALVEGRALRIQDGFAVATLCARDKSFCICPCESVVCP